MQLKAFAEARRCARPVFLSVGTPLLEKAEWRMSRKIGFFGKSDARTEIHVAEIPALILAKGSKIGERLREPRKGPVRDKDLGDLWRLMAVGASQASRRGSSRTSSVTTRVPWDWSRPG